MNINELRASYFKQFYLVKKKPCSGETVTISAALLAASSSFNGLHRTATFTCWSPGSGPLPILNISGDFSQTESFDKRKIIRIGDDVLEDFRGLD